MQKSLCYPDDRVGFSNSQDTTNIVAVNGKRSKYDESTPEKLPWANPPDIEARSRSKSRNKINPGMMTSYPQNNSDRKRNLPSNQSMQGAILAPQQSVKPNPKSSVVKRKAPGTSTRLFGGQPGGARGEEDYVAMHEELITEILREEEEVLGQHKEHIDAMYRSSKVEAKMIQEVDQPGSEITTYIDGLDGVLTQHLTDITRLQDRLNGFRKKLQEEHRLNKICNDIAQNPDPGMGTYPDTDPDFPEEPRSKAPRLQYNYDYPNPRNSNYNP